MILDYLKKEIVITDGAMGTYFAEISGEEISHCELANIENPKIIEEIHKEYIKAGAKLLRTNTFSANTMTLNISRDELKEILISGYRIAKKAVGEKDVFIGASIGPIHESKFKKDREEEIIDEYKFIIDTMMDEGEDIFIFETFGTTDYLDEVSKYIKNKNKKAFILAQFAVTVDGFTRKGVNINSILSDIQKIKNIDAYGFNCGSGPGHLYNLIKDKKIFGDIISALPNASYPEVVNERMIYVNNPDYFAKTVSKIVKLGAKIVGGCCGTTPKHIEKLSKYIDIREDDKKKLKMAKMREDKSKSEENSKNEFVKKVEKDKFVIAVELDPPFDTSIEKIIENAKECKKIGVDIITVADSPRGVARIDSVLVASKIKREVGIEVIPHMCCRDKNLNALKSSLLGAHIENIRNILAVTGDPVLDIDNMLAKSVFNLNSYKLMDLISEMNKEVFKNEEMNISGALNLNVKNKELEINRMNKKIESGANIFFTQPVFHDSTIDYIINSNKVNKTKIMVGIMPIISYRNAQFLNNEVPGINIPQEYIDRFNDDMSKEESEEVGIELAVEISNKLKKHVDGLYYITPFNRIDIIMKILDRIDMI